MLCLFCLGLAANGGRANPSYPFSVGAAYQPISHILPSGAYVVFYQSVDPNTFIGEDLVLQCFGPYGLPVGDPRVVSPKSGSYGEFPFAIIPSGDGGFFLFWHRSGSDQKIMFREYDGLCQPVSSAREAVQNFGGGISDISATRIPGGDILVLYEQLNGELELIAEVVRADGTSVGEPLVLTSSFSEFYAATCLGLPDGSFACAWQEDDVDNRTRLIRYAQINADGTQAGTTTTLDSHVVPDGESFFTYFLGDCRLSRNAGGESLLSYVFCNDNTHEHEVRFVRFTEPHAADGEPVVVHRFGNNGTFFSGLNNDGSATLLGRINNSGNTGTDVYTVAVNATNFGGAAVPLFGTDNFKFIFNDAFSHRNGDFVYTYEFQDSFSFPPNGNGYACIGTGESNPDGAFSIRFPQAGRTYGANGIPASFVATNSTLPVQLTFTPLSAGSDQITWDVNALDSDSTKSFVIDPGNQGQSPAANVTLLSGSVLGDGAWFASLNTSVGATSTSTFFVDSQTLPPSWISPVTGNQTFSDTLNISYSIPEEAYERRVKLYFTPVSAEATQFALNLKHNYAGAADSSFTWNLAEDAELLPNVISREGVHITAGTYDLTLGYHDALANPEQNITLQDITLDFFVPGSTGITLPQANGFYGGQTGLPISFTTATPGDSATLSLFPLDSSLETSVVRINEVAPGIPRSFSLFPPDISTALPSGVDLLSGGQVGEGLYDVFLNASGQTTTVRNVTIDLTTRAPQLTSPSFNSSWQETASLELATPEPALGNAVWVSFIPNGETSPSMVLNIAHAGAGLGDPTSFFWYLDTDPAMQPEVIQRLGDPKLYDGTYTVQLGYQDALGNPFQNVSVSSVTYTGGGAAPDSSEPPVVTFPLPNNTYGAAGVPVSFSSGSSSTGGALFFVPTQNRTLPTTQILVGGLVPGQERSFVLEPPLEIGSMPVDTSLVSGTLADGLYTLEVDVGGVFTPVQNITIDTFAQRPVLELPSANQIVYQGSFPVRFATPEPALEGLVDLSFVPVNTSLNTTTWFVLHNGANAEQFTEFTYTLGTDPVSSITEVVGQDGPDLAAGDYDVVLSYFDRGVNPSANVSAPLSLLAGSASGGLSSLALEEPVSGLIYNSFGIPFSISYQGVPSSMDLYLLPQINQTLDWNSAYHFGLSEFPVESPYNFILPTQGYPDLLPSGISILSGQSRLESGLYSVMVNAGGLSASVSDVPLDLQTAAPRLYRPVTNSSQVGNFNLSFATGEPAMEGVVELAFTPLDSSRSPLILQVLHDGADLNATTDLSWSLSEDPVNVLDRVVSSFGDPLVDGRYAVTLLYSDVAGNPPANFSATDVSLTLQAPDTATEPPFFLYPRNRSLLFGDVVVIPGFSEPMASANFTLIPTAQVNLQQVFTGVRHREPIRLPVSYFQELGLPEGDYQFVLAAADAAGNPPVNTSQDVRIFWELVDLNGNGMGDFWERRFFGRLGVDPNADFDGDGMSNLAEFLAGTDPTDPGSVLRITRVTGGASIEICAQAVPGRTYQLQSAAAADTPIWVNLGLPQTAEDLEVCFQVDPSAFNAGNFFRVIVVDGE